VLGGVGKAGPDGAAQQAGVERVARLDHAQAVLVGGHAGAGGVEGRPRHGPGRQPAVVDERHPVLERVHDHGVAAAARQLGRQVPVADRAAVDRGQRRPPGGDRVVELPRRGPRPARLVMGRRHLEPFEQGGHPAVRVLPAVAEAEHQRRGLVALELPQDVAGAQPAADAEDHRLGERLSGLGGDHAVVGEDVGDGGAVGVDAAAQGPRRGL
jgi:hypothetical protein